MRIFKLLPVFIILLLFISCGDQDNQDVTPIKKDKISGVIQKGPFINGSTVSVSEFDKNFTLTGRKFDSQIMDNSGLFTVKNIELESQYVELKADGFYFNEVHGTKSSAQLTLYSLSDLSDKDTVNVNILSHLERGRMLSLIDEGLSFDEAKQKARTEVLKIFGINPDDSADSFDDLDISQTGTSNAILLAASVILQGNRDTAGLSELIADIATDIRDDGTLDSESTISKIVTEAEALNLENIRANLDKRYKDLGVEFILPEFEKYVDKFLETYQDYILQFPEEGKYGKNLLYYLVNFEDLDEMINNGSFYVESGSYSVAAIIPDEKELYFFAGSENSGAMRADEESIEGWTETETEHEYSYSMKFRNSQKNADLKLDLISSETFLRLYIIDKKSGEMIREYGHNFRVGDSEQQDDSEMPDSEMPDTDDTEQPLFDIHEDGAYGPNLLHIIKNSTEDTITIEPGTYSLQTYFRNTDFYISLASECSTAFDDITESSGWNVQKIVDGGYTLEYNIYSTENQTVETENGTMYALDAKVVINGTEPGQSIVFGYSGIVQDLSNKTIILDTPSFSCGSDK